MLCKYVLTSLEPSFLELPFLNSFVSLQTPLPFITTPKHHTLILSSALLNIAFYSTVFVELCILIHRKRKRAKISRVFFLVYCHFGLGYGNDIWIVWTRGWGE